MLQQTQSKTVIPYYNRFLEHFPDIAALARAREEDILTLWSGLGYYNRARNMHKAARKIMQFNNGTFPADYKTILSLPGIGPYTAGAICSIALNQPHPIVDGNIRRVLARLKGLRKKMPEKYFWDCMRAWVPKDKASAFNQAIMEMGALICRPHQPLCSQCPVQSLCQAKKLSLQDKIPPPGSKQPVNKVELVLLVIEYRGKTLLIHQEKSFIPGTWGLPFEAVPVKGSYLPTAENLIGKLTGSRIQIDYLGIIRHSITHRRITAHIFSGKSTGKSLQLRINNGRTCWATGEHLRRMLTSSLFRKVLISLGG